MKKTLLIDARTGGDWSLDLTFAGLVKRLGPENVIDYPYHGKHREPIVFNGDPEHDWGVERRTLGWTPKNWLVPFYDHRSVGEEIVNGNIERIFLDERPESYALYLNTPARFYNIPVVVIAGHDRFTNDIPCLRSWYGTKLEHIFLDNWRPEYDGEKNVSLFNWSVNFDHYWPVQDRRQEKVYDISFMGYNSHPDRARFVDHVQKNWGHLNNHIFLEREPDTMRGFIQKGEYFDIMAKSKICLNLRGAAENGKTLRFYEIPYVGSFMLTQDSGTKQLYPFEQASHCAYFTNEEQLDNWIGHLLSNDHILKSIASRGHEHLMRHHTFDSRINQMYEVLGG